MEDNKNIIMGLDISTTCIGICLMEWFLIVFTMF